MTNRDGLAPIFIALIVAGLLIVGGIWYYETSARPRITPTPTSINQSLVSPTSLSTSTNASIARYASSSWQGKWSRKSGQFTPGTMVISKVTSSSFYFSIDASYGADTGSAEGDAIVNGVTAKSIVDKNAGADSFQCDLTFTLASSSIDVEFGDSAKNGPALCGGMGAGVVPIGVYYSEKVRSTPNSILNGDIFDNDAERAAFKALVGSSLSLFNNTAQVESPDTDVDGLDARVTDSFVFGAGNSASNIIMIAPGNKMWAAVTDGSDSEGNSIVRYFTNVPEYANKIPQTIQNWYSDTNQFIAANGNIVNVK